MTVAPPPCPPGAPGAESLPAGTPPPGPCHPGAATASRPSRRAPLEPVAHDAFDAVGVSLGPPQCPLLGYMQPEVLRHVDPAHHAARLIEHQILMLLTGRPEPQPGGAVSSGHQSRDRTKIPRQGDVPRVLPALGTL